ncbi:MAG TPA: hypothetical protein VKW76_09420 [Candidatus Binatia bacterium]|nr:hypothetical protein [Candidatus Binatia bacterium]
MNNDSTLDFTTFHGTSWALVIANGGTLDAGSGVATIDATSLDVAAGGKLTANGGLLSVNTSGDITVEAVGRSNGKIDVSGNSAVGGGGEVDLTSANGKVVLNGIVDAHGTDTNSDGGVINVTASGDIEINAAADNVRADSGSQGGGGDVCLVSQSGQVVVANEITAQGGAFDGGCISMDAHLNVQVGPLDASSSNGGGYGGMIMLTADGNVIMQGKENVQGAGPAGSAGDGGNVCNVATGALTVSATAPIQAQGGPGGSGGCVSLSSTNGPLVVRGAIQAQGSADAQGDVGSGGMVCLDGGPSADVTGAIDVSGPPLQASGGIFDGTALGTFTLESPLVDARGGVGEIQVEAPSIVVTSAAHLLTDDPGTKAQGADGGEVNLVASQSLNVQAGSVISSTGWSGFNLFQSCGTTAIAGTVTADTTTTTTTTTIPGGTTTTTLPVFVLNPCAQSPNCIQSSAQPTLTGATFTPPPQVLLGPNPACTTTTTTTSTTTTTMAGGTTTTTTLPRGTTTTTTTIPRTSTTSTTLPHVTTTTTLPPAQTPCATDAECTAGGECMVGHCAAGVCAYEDEPGAAGVMCLLGRVGTLLDTASPGAIRSAALGRALKGQLGKVTHLVETASGKHKATKVHKAHAALQAFMNKVRKAEGHKIDATLATEITDTAGMALQQLGTL